MADLLVDTDIFLDHLRGAHQFRPKRHRIHYSVVTRAELFAGNSGTDLCSQLLAPFREVDVDRAIAERAGRISREFGTRLPHALIAATAIERGFGVVTRNQKHSHQSGDSASARSTETLRRCACRTRPAPVAAKSRSPYRSQR